MFSYIFMKILESRPHRYDWGINFLTFGQARKIKENIVNNFVQPGMSVLDVGCGTGELAVKAAEAGADVTGLDISEDMLTIARKRLKEKGLKNKVTLHHAGIVEIDNLFEEKSFDLITSTLVISELYAQEREWSLRELYKVLKPKGTLLIVGEVKPQSLLKRIIYFTLRFPLAIITYIISQTGTEPVKNIRDEIHRAGFKAIEERYSFLESIITIVAKRSRSVRTASVVQALTPDKDRSFLKSIFDFCGRWFPNPVEPGLRIIGMPDRNSPIVVTGNFHLSVRRVEKALKGENCYLLVVQSRGINVWCASAGGELNTHSVITGLKTSRIGDCVDHKKLILPQFSAPGIDATLLKRLTGWKVRWGPAYAKELPTFFAKKYTKIPEQSHARFSLSFRLEMLVSMNSLLWFLLLVITVPFYPQWALAITLIFWSAGFILYAGYYFFPFNSGWLKALTLGILAMAIFMGASIYNTGSLWHYTGWMIFTFLTILFIGFDLKGIVGDRVSEAEAFMHKLGFETFGDLFRVQGVHHGHIQQDTTRCNNCSICLMVCPVGVYGITGNDKNIVIVDDSDCLNCNACVVQCPERALFLS